jgi:hypothetical protein
VLRGRQPQGINRCILAFGYNVKVDPISAAEAVRVARAFPLQATMSLWIAQDQPSRPAGRSNLDRCRHGNRRKNSRLPEHSRTNVGRVAAPRPDSMKWSEFTRAVGASSDFNQADLRTLTRRGHTREE